MNRTTRWRRSTAGCGATCSRWSGPSCTGSTTPAPSATRPDGGWSASSTSRTPPSARTEPLSPVPGRCGRLSSWTRSSPSGSAPRGCSCGGRPPRTRQGSSPGMRATRRSRGSSPGHGTGRWRTRSRSSCGATTCGPRRARAPTSCSTGAGGWSARPVSTSRPGSRPAPVTSWRVTRGASATRRSWRRRWSGSPTSPASTASTPSATRRTGRRRGCWRRRACASKPSCPVTPPSPSSRPANRRTSSAGRGPARCAAP